jgi:hypothetical protein
MISEVFLYIFLLTAYMVYVPATSSGLQFWGGDRTDKIVFVTSSFITFLIVSMNAFAIAGAAGKELRDEYCEVACEVAGSTMAARAQDSCLCEDNTVLTWQGFKGSPSE